MTQSSEFSKAPGAMSDSVGLFCVNCSYDLRSLSPDGQCPECGVPIAHSYGPRLMKKANRKWIARVCTGLLLLQAGMFGLVLFILGGMVFLVVTTARVQSTVFTIGLSVISVGVLFGLVACWVGTWIVTSHEPGIAEHFSKRDPRRTARAMLIAAPLGGILPCVLMSYLGVQGLVRDFTLLVCTTWFSIAILILGFLVLTILSEFAERIPNPELSHKATKLRDFFAIVVIAVVLLRIAANILPLLNTFFMAPRVLLLIRAVTGMTSLAFVWLFMRSILVVQACFRDVIAIRNSHLK